MASSSRPIRMSDLAYGMQPVVHKPAALAVHGGADTPTAVMSDDHDVLHLQHVDSELKDREIIGVLRRGEVRDVAMDEQLARIKTHDGIGRHAAVGAADPQILRRLLCFEPPEEVRVLRQHPRCPGAVLFFQIIQQRTAHDFMFRPAREGRQDPDPRRHTWSRARGDRPRDAVPQLLSWRDVRHSSREDDRVRWRRRFC